MTRPQYSEVDNNDRIAHLGSRNNILNKSFVTDLWMKVIHRAIDDIVIYRTMRLEGKELKEEELDYEESANQFLFNDYYRIPLDDYSIDITCSTCNSIFIDKMSSLSSNCSCCPYCSSSNLINNSKYEVSLTTVTRDVNLKELLALWGMEDIDGFRKGIKQRIEELVKKKVESNKNKPNRNEQMTKDNFEQAKEKDLTNFDKGIIKVLEEIKDMLMSKNRKYGNSATQPVRAFSKADPIEQIKVRIDDKISRLVRSTSSKDDEDVVVDLIGYLVILHGLNKNYL